MQDKDLQELLKLAKKDVKSSITYELLDEATKFIKSKNIQIGEHKIYNYVIYDAYIKWKKNKSQSLGKTAFFREFAKHFQGKRDWKGRYYLLTTNAFDLTPENIRKAKELYGSRKTKKTKKKS